MIYQKLPKSVPKMTNSIRLSQRIIKLCRLRPKKEQAWCTLRFLQEAEDFKLGKKLGLPMIPVIEDDACYMEGLGFFVDKMPRKIPE